MRFTSKTLFDITRRPPIPRERGFDGVLVPNTFGRVRSRSLSDRRQQHLTGPAISNLFCTYLRVFLRDSWPISVSWDCNEWAVSVINKPTAVAASGHAEPTTRSAPTSRFELWRTQESSRLIATNGFKRDSSGSQPRSCTRRANTLCRAR